MAPSTPSSSRISTAIARSLVACSRPWCAQKSKSAPPGRIARTAARAPHRSQRSAGETGGAAGVVVITSYPTPNTLGDFPLDPVCCFPLGHGRMSVMSTPTMSPRTAAPKSGGARAAITARTLRQDRCGLQPLVIAIGFAGFVVYATWAAFNHPVVAGTDHRIYFADPYLSPLYSPCFMKGCPTQISWAQLNGPMWISPAIYILIFPLAFRATCYYYRKAYYRSFWLSPPACAVAEPHGKYTGETRFPLVLQNAHRYFFYLGLVLNVFLTYEAILAFEDPEGGIGMGLGTLILLINAALLWLYSLSCHSCRNSVGGRINNFSKHPARYWAWTKVS